VGRRFPPDRSCPNDPGRREKTLAVVSDPGAVKIMEVNARQVVAT
jgi:hypothetical protein